MKARNWIHNRVVAAGLLLLGLALPAAGQTPTLDDLFDALKDADAAQSQQLEQEIWTEWSKSGSAAMDLLLQRGRDATMAGENEVAIEHLTALIDHAPEFAEGWNARATAYYQAGLYGPAVEDIAHTLTLNPRHFGALSGLGMIFEDLGQPEKALEVYKAALAIHPHLQGVLDAVARIESDTAGQDL